MRFSILVFSLLAINISLSGQELSYRSNLPITDSLQQQIRTQFDQGTDPHATSAYSALQIPTYVIPSYARQNPSGYSYLCRLELQIEDELPLGLWIRADEKAAPGGSVYLRMKLIRF